MFLRFVETLEVNEAARTSILSVSARSNTVSSSRSNVEASFSTGWAPVRMFSIIRLRNLRLSAVHPPPKTLRPHSASPPAMPPWTETTPLPAAAWAATASWAALGSALKAEACSTMTS